MYKRGVPGELACVCCFELNCFGCSVFARALSLETMENLLDYSEECREPLDSEWEEDA